MNLAVREDDYPDVRLLRKAWDVLKRRNPDMQFFDVGTHVGYISFAAAAAGFETISIEAFPENVDRLRVGLELNSPSIRSRVNVIPIAISGPDDAGGFLYIGSLRHAKWATNAVVFSSLKEARDFQEIVQKEWQLGRKEELGELVEVPVTTIDSLLYSPVPSRNVTIQPSRLKLWKIDIEGREGFAFEGAKRYIRNIHPVTFWEPNKALTSRFEEYQSYEAVLRPFLEEGYVTCNPLTGQVVRKGRLDELLPSWTDAIVLLHPEYHHRDVFQVLGCSLSSATACRGCIFLALACLWLLLH